MDRQYTVEECYALCTNEPDCGAFVITKVNFDTDLLDVLVSRKQVDGQFPKAACLLFREGCNREGSTLQHLHFCYSFVHICEYIFIGIKKQVSVYYRSNCVH